MSDNPILSEFPAPPAAPKTLDNDGDELEQHHIMQLTAAWAISQEVHDRALTIRAWLHENMPPDEYTAAALLTLGSMTYQEVLKLKQTIQQNPGAERVN